MEMYYFAYGSNLLQTRMKYRVPSARFKTIGYLPQYKLVFNLFVGGSGKCDIIETRDPNDEVWGAIYELPFWRIKQLDQYEGHPSIYHRKEHNIQGSDGRDYNAQVYVGSGTWHRKHALPFDWYAFHVALGAYQLGLPKDYQTMLRKTPYVKDFVASRFRLESMFWEKP